MKKEKNALKVLNYICLSVIFVFSLMTFIGCGGGGGDEPTPPKPTPLTLTPDTTISDLSKALNKGDVDQAIELFDASVQEKYRDIFDAAKGHLPEIANELENNIQEVYVKETGDGGVAKYKITREENGQEIVSYILLMKINDEWKIVSF